MPKISVWLTSYNHDKFIRQSIESILAQTYEDFELYIVDDCSTDSSWDIIQEYAGQDERIKPIRHTYNYGHSGFNEMLDELDGEYVAIAHCDDAWNPEKLEKQVKVLEENKNIAACFTLVQVIGDDGEEITSDTNVYHGIFQQSNRTRFEWLNYFFYNGNCLCHPSMLIRKKAYRDYGLFTKGLNGLPDYCKWIRLCRNADIYILQEQLTRFRVHGDGSNTSGDNSKSNIRLYTEEWLVLKEFVGLIDSHEVGQVFPEAQQLIVDSQVSEKYVLAKIMLEHPRHAYKLFGLQLLYDMFQNQQQEEEMKQLYAYTAKDFNLDKQKYDIFGLIPQNRYMDVNIYLDGTHGYSEDNKISLQIFIQQTGAFNVKVDLSKYSLDMLENVRVDLDEGRYRKFRLTKCVCDEENVEYENVNGVHEEEWDIFYTLDPQYVFKFKSSGLFCIEGYTEEVPCGNVEQYHSGILQKCNEAQQRYAEIQVQQHEFQRVYEQLRQYSEQMQEDNRELQQINDALQQHTDALQQHSNALQYNCNLLNEEITRMQNTKVWRARNKILRILGK